MCPQLSRQDAELAVSSLRQDLKLSQDERESLHVSSARAGHELRSLQVITNSCYLVLCYGLLFGG